VTKYETLPLVLEFDYGIMGTLMNCLKQLNVEIKDKDLSAQPSITLEINKSEVTDRITAIKAKMLSRAIADIEDDTEVTGLRFSIPS